MNKAILCAVLGHVFWGFSYIFTKTGQQHVSPEMLLSMRFITAFIMMNLMILFKIEKVSFKGKNLKPVLLLAVTELSYFFFEAHGILHTNATFAGVVMAVVPVVSIFTGILFLREYPSRKQALYCIVPVAGVILMTVSGKAIGAVETIGVIFLMCSCFASAMYKTANKKSAEEFSPFERTYVLLFACAVMFTAMTLVQIKGDLSVYKAAVLEPQVIIAVIMLSVIGSIGANILVNYAAGRMSVVNMSTYGTLTTLVSAFAGIVFLKEPVSLMFFIGGVLIVFGIWKVTKSGN